MRYAPDYVIFPCWSQRELANRVDLEPLMRPIDYSLVHFSGGYVLYKRGRDIR